MCIRDSHCAALSALPADYAPAVSDSAAAALLSAVHGIHRVRFSRLYPGGFLALVHGDLVVRSFRPRPERRRFRHGGAVRLLSAAGRQGRLPLPQREGGRGFRLLLLHDVRRHVGDCGIHRLSPFRLRFSECGGHRRGRHHGGYDDLPGGNGDHLRPAGCAFVYPMEDPDFYGDR